MYIGGMAGTGKSQVIKALIKFFERNNSPLCPDHGTYRISCCISVWLYISFCSGINGYQANESIKTISGSMRDSKDVNMFF